MQVTLFLKGEVGNLFLLASISFCQWSFVLSMPVPLRIVAWLRRYTQPVCMKDLLQRFDTVLTPPSLFKSATARSIQLGTIDAAAVKKK